METAIIPSQARLQWERLVESSRRYPRHETPTFSLSLIFSIVTALSIIYIPAEVAAGTKAEADAKRARRAKICFIMVTGCWFRDLKKVRNSGCRGRLHYVACVRRAFIWRWSILSAGILKTSWQLEILQFKMMRELPSLDDDAFTSSRRSHHGRQTGTFFFVCVNMIFEGRNREHLNLIIQTQTQSQNQSRNLGG